MFEKGALKRYLGLTGTRKQGSEEGYIMRSFKLQWGDLKERDYIEDVGVDGKYH